MRWGLALVLLPHGAQKVLGWFGGVGPAATWQYFTQTLGIAGPLAAAAILTEFVGPLLLAAGFLVRPASIAIAILMGVAATYHLENGFFMNWFGNQAGEGIEFHILAVVLSGALVIRGGGALSLDRVLSRRD